MIRKLVTGFALSIIVLPSYSQHLMVKFSVDTLSIAPQDVSVEINLNGDRFAKECNTPVKANGMYISPCILSKPIETMFIKINARFKKQFSQYVLPSQIKKGKNNELLVDLGFLNFVAADSIRILNILKRDVTDRDCFELSLLNPHDYAVTIQSARIRAQNNYTAKHNFFGDPADTAVISIDPNITIQTTDTNSLTATLQYREKLLKESSAVHFLCHLGFNSRLNYDFVDMDIPCNQLLPANSSRTLLIYMPHSFKTSVDNELAKKQLIRAKRFADFHLIQFVIYHINPQGSGQASYLLRQE